MKMRLTAEEEWDCARTALERIDRIKAKADDVSRYDQKLNFHEYVCQVADSIGAEFAVAKYFQIKDFDPRNSRFKETADVGSRIEVKWTKYDMGSLIIYESDRNTDIAVLVTGKSPHYYVKGWIPVAIAKNPRWKHRTQPTWWVDQYNLHPIENLLRSSHGVAAL